MVVFIRSGAFTRRLLELADGATRFTLQQPPGRVARQCAPGRYGEGAGGIPKPRALNPLAGQGKRSGLRCMELYWERKGHLDRLFRFDKDRQEDLNPTQPTFLGQLGNVGRSQKRKPRPRKSNSECSTISAVLFRRTGLGAESPRQSPRCRTSCSAPQASAARNLPDPSLAKFEPGTVCPLPEPHPQHDSKLGTSTRRAQGADPKLLAIAKRNPQAILKA
jgi:hypothetical protein